MRINDRIRRWKFSRTGKFFAWYSTFRTGYGAARGFVIALPGRFITPTSPTVVREFIWRGRNNPCAT